MFLPEFKFKIFLVLFFMRPFDCGDFFFFFMRLLNLFDGFDLFVIWLKSISWSQALQFLNQNL